MALAAHRWLMTAPKAPMVQAGFDPFPPAAGEVAGGGRRLRRLPHRSRLLLRRRPHAITRCRSRSGTRSPAAWSPPATARELDRARGHRPGGDPVRRMRAVPARARPNICRRQKMPGNDIHGGFATHIVVPARGLCPVDEAHLAGAGLSLAELSVVADAVTTPYQAVVRAGVCARRRSRSSSAPAASAATACRSPHACGATRRRDRRRRRQARHHRQARRGARRSTRASWTRKALKTAIARLRQAERRCPATEWIIFEMIGHRGRPADRLRPPRPRRDPERRRLHHGQGRGAALEPDGVRRARDRQLGLPPGALPGGARPRARAAAVADQAVRRDAIRSPTSTACLDAVHHRDIKRRAVLVP